jgi:Tfp pilus assembly protein PilO
MNAYRLNRGKKIKQLHADINKTSAEQGRKQAVEADIAKLMRQLPSEPGTTLFIESLYRIARESGLKQHEVSTDADKSSGTARPGGQEGANATTRQRLKISAVGTYRNFSEYIRRIQNFERFNRITDFKFVPDNAGIKCILNIELYSLPVKR